MNEKLNILGLLISKDHPSSRARILQYLPSLKDENIIIHPRTFSLHKNSTPTLWMTKTGKATGINPWRILRQCQKIIRLPLLYEQNKFDMIWQNRLIITHHSWYEKKLTTPRIFDFDDAIWLQDGEKHVQKVISTSNHVFAGNEYLADYASQYSKNVSIIPSVIDTSKLFPKPKNDNRFIIGWVGSSSNLPYLEIIKPAIIQFLRKNADAAFVVISSEPGEVFNYDNRQIIFRKWVGEKENDMINTFSIGLMPLPDNPFTRGKCGYKLLQYLACGIPVLASPVGINKRILSNSQAGLAATTTDEWLKGIFTFKNDPEFYKHASENGPIYIESKYSVKKFAPTIADQFRKITGK